MTDPLMSSRRRTRSPEEDSGAVVVEFALILPFLLLLVFGIMSFGQAYNTQIALQGAAREGARALALDNDPISAAANSTNLDITVDPGPACDGDDPNAVASVTTTRNVDFQIPFFFVGTKTLTATARMRCGL